MRDYTAQPVPHSVWEKPSHFIAFGFGSGAVPFAPGTFGTLMAIPFYLAMQSLSHNWYLFLVIFITLASMWLCDKVTKEIKVHDHSGMCLDEIVGYLVTMYAAPHGVIWIIVGFLLFRLFDIWKPWPIHLVDRYTPGGLGVMVDDLLAAVYAWLSLHIIALFAVAS